MKNVAVLKKAENGKSYRRYDYELAIFYGGPEVKAQLIWNDKVCASEANRFLGLIMVGCWHIFRVMSAGKCPSNVDKSLD